MDEGLEHLDSGVIVTHVAVCELVVPDFFVILFVQQLEDGLHLVVLGDGHRKDHRAATLIDVLVGWGDLVHQFHDLGLKTLLGMERDSVAVAVGILQVQRGANALELSVDNHCDSIGQDVCFFHGMGSQDNGPVLFEFEHELPNLVAGDWIHSCGGFIQENDLWVSDRTDGNRESSLHSS